MNREELPQEASREDKMRDALKHYEELATKACWHRSDIPDAIRAYYASLPPAEGAELSIETIKNEGIKYLQSKYPNKDILRLPDIDGGSEFADFTMGLQVGYSLNKTIQQPTAEGAEEIRKEYSEESLNFFRLFIKARKELCAISPTETYSLEESIRKAFDGFFPRPLSIVDDAETILNSHPYLKVWIENLYDSEMKVCSIEQAIWAIEKAATLHAQRIAEKMVSERMEQYKAQFKDRPNPLEVNPYDSKGIKRIRNRKIH